MPPNVGAPAAAALLKLNKVGLIPPPAAGAGVPNAGPMPNKVDVAAGSVETAPKFGALPAAPGFA